MISFFIICPCIPELNLWPFDLNLIRSSLCPTAPKFWPGALWCGATTGKTLKKEPTRKRGNWECIATWGCPTPCQSLSTLIMTPMPSLKSLNLSVAVLTPYLTQAVNLTFDLDLWPCDLNICSVSPVKQRNSVPSLSEIEQSTTELLQFQYLTLCPWTCITWSAMLWDNLHKV